MKSKIIIWLTVLVIVLLGLQSVAVAEPAVPAEADEPIELAFSDPIFLQAVREILGKTNGEHIYQSDVENIAKLEVFSLDITSLAGIQYFTGLKELYCYDNEITVLDLSHNTNLEVLDCSYNTCMNFLDVSNCPELQVVECNYNIDLQSLDLSKNLKLKKLICYSTDLETLDVSCNPLLEILDIYDTDLVSLDVSNHPKLEHLDCSYGEYLVSIDASNCPELKLLDFSNTYVESLDVSQCSKLTALIGWETDLKALDISTNPLLEKLEIWGGYLVTLDVSHNPKLKYLDCRYHDMCDIDSVVGIENCTELAADKFFFAPQNIVDRGHSWDGGKITIEPSCMEKGETTYTCTHCGISKTEEIAAIGYHVLEPDWDMDRENHWHTCTVCDAQLDKSNHSYHNRQDTVCNVCGYQRSSNVSVGHNASSYRSFTITAAAGKGGKIMPEGKVSVRDGVNKTFTIIPDSGYEIADVLVDGKSVGAVTDYLFEKVNHEHCIEVRFQESANSGGYQMCSKDEHCPIWRYTDAGVGEWYHDGVHFCIENGLMRGDGNNQFRPADTLTRGMLVQILYNEAGRPAVSGSCSFDDVVSDRWYANAVIWAAQEGIVKGFDNHRFAPDVPITREQLAVMLYRYEQTHGGGFHGNWLFRLDFHDADTINEWAYEAICWLTMNQVILGEENRTLRPKGLVTRAEAAMMVQRYFNVLL